MNENTEINKNKEKPAQTHKIGIYLWIWGLLFVLSFFSYMVDWYQFQGILRWSLILFFMFLSSLSPLAKSGILLTLGLSIFGFADNLTLLVSDEVSVGQFHFSRSLSAIIIVITFAYFSNTYLVIKKDIVNI